ncbi:MAG: hypothetical protein IJT06_02100 [Selenomonadaceae bacterium]|nr:hypothetical protein [Selenomonadaceae bacterium]
MKNFFVLAIFAAVLILFQSPQAEASELYLGEWEGGWKAYLLNDKEHVNYDFDDDGTLVFYLSIKAVSQKGTVKIIDYVFRGIYGSNDKLIGASFRDSLGASGTFYHNNPGVYIIEHKAFFLIADALARDLYDKGQLW